MLIEAAALLSYCLCCSVACHRSMELMCVGQCVSCTINTSTWTANHMALQLQQTSCGPVMVEMKWSLWPLSLLESVGTVHFLVRFSFHVPRLCSSGVRWHDAILVEIKSRPSQIGTLPLKIHPPLTLGHGTVRFRFHTVSHYRPPGVKGVRVMDMKGYTLPILDGSGYRWTRPHPTYLDGAQMTRIPVISRWRPTDAPPLHAYGKKEEQIRRSSAI